MKFQVESIGIDDTGPVFTWYQIDTKIFSIAHPYKTSFVLRKCCFLFVLSGHAFTVLTRSVFKASHTFLKPLSHSKASFVAHKG